MKRRSKVEMEALDRKIQPLYERGLGCRIIAQVLEDDPTVVYRRAKRLGILRDSEEAGALGNPTGDSFFTNPRQDKNLRVAGIGIATRWFLERGYMASVPVEAATYDLVVESDKGLQRVQVKTTTAKDKYGRWSVSIHRQKYKPEVTPSAAGKYRKAPYTRDEMDVFFIATLEGDVYVIPLEKTKGAMNITLDKKYAGFRVR